jgi:murein DD-endopeptidase MepM/ murein hydrolase activator NlpD
MLDRKTKRPIGLIMSIFVVLAIVAGYFLYRTFQPAVGRMARLRRFLSDSDAYREWMIHAGERCGEAPFLMPTDGYIGFFWGDSFAMGRTHQGLDIFGPAGLGETPVVAAYAGYLTRLPEWRSAVILRIPEDPLHPDRQIWIYYTHMADAEGNSFIHSEFPPGTYDAYVPAGTLLGFQGNYSADPASPTGMHLHFSVVLDDGRGRYKNELEFGNTLDPSPYLGLEVNAQHVGGEPAICSE